MQERTAREVKRTALEQDALTAEAVSLCRGKILKDTGDGHFIEFPSCSDAARCGYTIQQNLRSRNAAIGDDALKFELHVAIDIGDTVVMPNGDIRANSANLASRVSSLCPAGDVYMTDRVAHELNGREATVEWVSESQIRGCEGPVAIFRLKNWIGEIETTPNPFIWRDGISQAAAFFNRSREIKKTLQLMRSKQNCQIVGSRRIGKSSLLRHFERTATEEFSDASVAYVDLQDPRCYTLAGWLMFVSKQWNWAKTPTNLVEFADGVESMLRADYRPVLCLDEFEEPAVRRSEFNRDFFLTLRSCGQKGLTIITASLRPLNELTEDKTDPTSPFYNTFQLLRLGPFNETDASEFVSMYRNGISPFNDEQKREILNFAKGHPLALQVACYYVLEGRETNEPVALSIGRAADELKVTLPSGH